MINKFPVYIQPDSKDCGPTCLKIVSKFYGKYFSIRYLREIAETTRIGSNMLMLSVAAEKIGFRTLGAKLTLNQFDDVPLPCILHWNQNHYLVLFKIKNNKSFFNSKIEKQYVVSDPSHGIIKYTEKEFKKFWLGSSEASNDSTGIVLLLEPTPDFYSQEDNNKTSFNLKSLIYYIKPYKTFIFQIFLGLTAGTFLQIAFPFLTQSIVDVGVQGSNKSFIVLILIAQLFLFLGKISIEIIRNFILVNISSRINISLISNFFIKLMNLPISFFDVRITGDIMQRIADHQRIERLLTSSSINTLFSVVNMFFMGAILAFYNLKIFLIFLIGSLLYFFWFYIFQKKREEYDYKRFSESAKEQSKVMEIINGMQEIKLHNAELQKRWGWEKIQVKLFKISIDSLVLEQTQNIGSSFINELKNIIILFLSASLVIDGKITLGTMLAISTIVGSLNGPILQLIEFMREFQDAKIALTRLSEIHERESEDKIEENTNHEATLNNEIVLKNVSFRYPGAFNYTLQKLNLTIPANNITAIVGSSGSGKTTLMKLLLKFYSPDEGEIFIDNQKMEYVSSKTWRNLVGTVMQEGYIFNDTLANNIALGEEMPNYQILEYAIEVANLKSFVAQLPKGIHTEIGQEGIGMSTGQRQRILIARAVYKNPNILFFDEATSALDANNEKEIMEKLNVFFKSKTVIVVAHRLSTVINANQIVVLENGTIVEIGNHKQLVEKRGYYFELVRKQLNLGE